MPELPEVETTVRALRKPLVGRVITAVNPLWPGNICKIDVAEFKARICGGRVTAVTRRGKYLLFPLSTGDTLIIHLRMSGHLAVVPHQLPLHKHDRTLFTLDNDTQLRFRDQRKFGTITLVADPSTILGKLGPEPLSPDFTAHTLQKQLANRNRPIKTLLLDQTRIAGIGNIYADEALYYAHLHPTQSSTTLTQTDITLLHQAIQKVLKLGIKREGASIDLYTKPDGSKGDMQNAVAVFRRTGEPCYECGTPVEKIKLGGRSTHFCPVCQPLK